MAQLVVKRTPWWSTPFAKHAMFWIPIAGLQAGTLAGLGYFYNRLSDIEQNSVGSSPVASAPSTVKPVSVADAPAVDVEVQPVLVDRSMPSPAPVPLHAALAVSATHDMMRAGERFQPPSQATTQADVAEPVAVAAISPVKPEAVVEKKPQVTEKVVDKKSEEKKTSKPVAASKPAPVVVVDVGTDPTALANQSELPAIPVSVPDVVAATVALPDEPATTAPEKPYGGAPTPVGVVAWVYIGELRDYGWYGQKLHIPPKSGLPELGRSYRTQTIHGLYETLHGKRVMGGFQLGDTVLLHEVQVEAGGKVWARVEKLRSAGR